MQFIKIKKNKKASKTRNMIEFIPAFTILAAILFWKHCSSPKKRSRCKRNTRNAIYSMLAIEAQQVVKEKRSRSDSDYSSDDSSDEEQSTENSSHDSDNSRDSNQSGSPYNLRSRKSNSEKTRKSNSEPAIRRCRKAYLSNTWS